MNDMNLILIVLMPVDQNIYFLLQIFIAIAKTWNQQMLSDLFGALQHVFQVNFNH
jgi:hypothetical protein